jgi:hypothetical protein
MLPGTKWHLSGTKWMLPGTKRHVIDAKRQLSVPRCRLAVAKRVLSVSKRGLSLARYGPSVSKCVLSASKHGLAVLPPAQRGDLRQGALQTGLAVITGLLLALAVGRVLTQILYEVSPNDPFALVTSSLLLAVASLLACFFPARRAINVSPMTALRTE